MYTLGTIKTRKSNLKKYFVGTALILSVPFIAMMITDEVQWDLRDFVIIGGLLLSAGISFELLTSRMQEQYRFLIAIFFVVTVMLIWAELAVGLFNSPLAGS